MSGFRGLWIDDVRPIPVDLIEQEWCSARSAQEALVKLELLYFEEVSFDHDLGPNSMIGNKELTGYDVLLWLTERKVRGLKVPNKIYIHSANPVGVQNMKALLERYWD